MAKIYLLHKNFDPEAQRQVCEIKNAFAAEHLAFFILALDTSTKVGGASHQGLKVLERACELLTEARAKLELEFN